MRSLPLTLVVVVGATLAACPLPDDAFTVTGTWDPGSEVRLFRNREASKTRCSSLELIDTTTADATGAFSFTVLRQVITGGTNERRFFSVESGTGLKKVKRFWFPDADLSLGTWVEPAVDSPETEVQLDESIAWRGRAPTFERPSRERQVWNQQDWVEVPIDSLGRYDVIPIQTRYETDWVDLGGPPGGAVLERQLRGAECPFIDVTPCPLTDGRYLSWNFPPDTRTFVLSFKQELAANVLRFHGLVLERPAVRVRAEFNFVQDFTQWNPLITSVLNPRLFEEDAANCSEPGAFFSSSILGAFAVILRVGFVDQAGELIPIIALQEVSTP